MKFHLRATATWHMETWSAICHRKESLYSLCASNRARLCY